MKYNNPTIQRINDSYLKLAELLATISGVIIIGMMTVLFVDVVLSKLFNYSVPRQIELVTYFHVPVVYLALVFVQLTESHATVDLLYDKLSRKARTVLDYVWYVVGIVVCGFETYTSLQFTVEKITLNTLSNTKNGFHVWPFAAVMALGWLLLCLSYVWCIIRYRYKISAAGADLPVADRESLDEARKEVQP